MDYLNSEHEQRFYKLLNKDKTEAGDKERKSLFYILSGNVDLYQKKNSIYDWENHCIILCLNKKACVDLSSGAKSLVKLGFNLYNGMKQRDNSVCDIFWFLDEENSALALNAIKMRFM